MRVYHLLIIFAMLATAWLYTVSALVTWVLRVLAANGVKGL